MLVNFFYLSILGVDGILSAPAVATEYAKVILPQVSWIIPIMVACSCLGAALVQGMTAARIPFVAARQNQFPRFLSMIHMFYLTPAPAVILNGFLATLMVVPNDFNSLGNVKTSEIKQGGIRWSSILVENAKKSIISVSVCGYSILVHV